jgi:sugar/nucleoside kinase (ribokinase family)
MITAVGNPVYDEIETPFVKTDGRVLSGCSTNFCLTLAKLGMKAALVGNVGLDTKSKLGSDLARFGVEHVLFDSSETGGFNLRYFGDHGERELRLLGDAGPIARFPKEYLASEYIVFGPILGEIDSEYIRLVRSESNAKIVLDPQGILRIRRDGEIVHEKTPDVKELMSLCDIVKPNELECEVLTGIDPRVDSRTPAEIIKSWGPELVIITLAELGSVIYDGEEFIRIPPYETDAMDSTGAGDTYLGGFMYGYVNREDLHECGCMGSAVASVMIEHTGPDFPLDLAEASARRDRLLRMKSEPEFAKREGRIDGQG